MNATTFNRVQKVFAHELGVDAVDVTLDAHIEADLGADSLDVVQLLMGVEEEFEIEIPDAAAEPMTRIRDVVAYVDAALAAQALAGSNGAKW